MKSSSNSSGQAIPLKNKLIEWYEHFKMRSGGKAVPEAFDGLFGNIEEYDFYLNKYCGLKLKDAKVLEIGFGARPLRLIALISMKIDAQGVDLDQPVLLGSLDEFVKMVRTNGWERALKSTIRFALFDKKERQGLGQALKKRGGWRLTISRRRFHVVDATSEEFTRRVGRGNFDLIYSEDVFEHIPGPGLEAMLARMETWLRPDGIAVIRPNIYTGITGNHLTEWYHHTLGDTSERRSEPWEHLRQNRFQANTYLNELWRADYRKLFSEHFDILEEKDSFERLGEEYLTGKTKEDLKDISEEDLFSNQVLFVLRRKKPAADS